MDKLIERQLRRAGLSAEALPDRVEAWKEFLGRVSRSYVQQQQDRYLLERSLDVSSREMQALYDDLRRASASEVAAERDKLSAIINGFRDGFCALELDGTALMTNPAAARLFGGSDPLVGTTLLDHVSFSRREGKSAPPLPGEILERVREQRSYRDDRATLRTLDGRSIPVSVLVYPIMQAEEVTGCALSIRDVTRLLDAEAARLRLAKAVEASADAIYITDIKGLIEYVNPAFTRITGFSAAQATGATPRLLASGETPASVYHELWQTINRGEVWSGRLLNRRQTRAGETLTYWAQTTIAPLPGDDDSLLGFVAVQRDVSLEVHEELRRERETRMAEARARAAEYLQGSGRLEQRLDQALGVLFAIPSLCLSGAALVVACRDGRPDDIKLRKGAPPSVVFQTLRGSELEDVDALYLPALNGVMLPIRQAGALVGGAWLGVEQEPELDSVTTGLLALFAGMIGVAIADDRARNEAERARLAALEAVEAKSRFLANMSHEIRTPMNGVLGMLEMLSQTSLDSDQQDYVETALGSADALLTVINDILDFSKIEAGKLDIERIPFDLRPLAEDVATLFSSRNQSDRLEVACYVPVDVETRVIGDPNRLRQVLSNLMGNAIKFTERGEVVLRVRAEPRETPKEGELWLRFDINDTGIGMTDEQLSRLFLPFVQADGSTTRRFGGTGLGLAISKQLVELMGGEIGAESVYGVGSRFWLRIPFERQDAKSGTVDSANLTGLQVLAVDDNETNRTILSHYLSGWGVNAETVGDGFQALNRLRHAVASGTPFEIVILDMQMPQLDGLTLARLIKSDPALSATRLLMISSGGPAEDETGAVDIQFSLSKPIRQAHLFEALSQMVRSGHATAGAGQQAPASERSAEQEEASAPLRGRILLVEDNLINQRVALSMLARLGLSADLAEDGRQALEAVDKQHYDLVLMDCQMPNMDGFEASTEIRREEASHERRPTVIVALTANAMEGDRERCIAAGMDDYIPKPLRLEQLRICLERWLKPDLSAEQVVDSTVEPVDALTALAIDPDVMQDLKELLGPGYAHFLELFETKTTELMQKIEQAVASDDPEALASAAHALKGSAGNLGAASLVTVAQRLEQRGQRGNLRDIDRLLEQARRSHRSVLEQLATVQRMDAPVSEDEMPS
jgi:PAS domain S-box-containing protein